MRIALTFLLALSGLLAASLPASAEPVASTPPLELVPKASRGSCPSNANTLCLLGGRFAVSLEWRAAGGTTADATAVSLTDDAGYFFFNNPNNIEVVVKMVNACSFNNRFWVFAAGLTNVEATLTVTEGFAPNVYTNPLGSPFQPIQDTSAFATCS